MMREARRRIHICVASVMVIMCKNPTYDVVVVVVVVFAADNAQNI